MNYDESPFLHTHVSHSTREKLTGETVASVEIRI